MITWGMPIATGTCSFFTLSIKQQKKKTAAREDLLVGAERSRPLQSMPRYRVKVFSCLDAVFFLYSQCGLNKRSTQKLSFLSAFLGFTTRTLNLEYGMLRSEGLHTSSRAFKRRHSGVFALLLHLKCNHHCGHLTRFLWLGGSTLSALSSPYRWRCGKRQ